MSLDAAAIAANRFGLGARPGELAAISGDPRGWLLAQLTPEDAPPAPLSVLPTTAVAAGQFTLWLKSIGLLGPNGAPTGLYGRDDKPGAAGGGGMGGASPSGASMSGTAMTGAADGAQKLGVEQSYIKYFAPAYEAAVEARHQVATTTERPFFERLTRFWANHFTVSAAKPEIIALAPVFERDVVRPHVCGRFDDMLLASCRHPGMLIYLDNYLSIGPDSPLAHHPEFLPPYLRERMKGLNENLGREILELHTLGVRSGYSQADVTTLAKIITGWSIRRPGTVEADGQVFRYIDFAHEPGSQTLLGVTYEARGEDQGRSALTDLARHPATARRVATKLARHFIADEPPPPAVDRIAKAFAVSQGDLKATALALVESPEAWAPAQMKMKPPDDYVVSAARALGGPPLKGRQLVALLDRMGQRPFWPPGPDGWSDLGDSWIGADPIWKRVEFASALADGHAAANLDPAVIAEAALGPQLSTRTRQAIRQAESPSQGLALFLVSPEFQRR